jgi:hypothetical protein
MVVHLTGRAGQAGFAGFSLVKFLPFVPASPERLAMAGRRKVINKQNPLDHVNPVG